MKKYLLAIIPFLLLAAACNKQQTAQVQPAQNQPTPSQQAQATSTLQAQQQSPGTITDGMAGWKLYTSSQYGYEFQYPSNWTVTYNDPGGNGLQLKSPDFASKAGYESITSGAGLFVGQLGPGGFYGDGDANTKLDAFAKSEAEEMTGDLIENEKFLTVDGQNAVMFNHHSGDGNNNHDVVLIDKDNEAYQLQEEYSITSKNPYEQLFNQIVSTFKFTN